MGPTFIPIDGMPEAFRRQESGNGVKLTTDLPLMSRLRVNGVTTTLPEVPSRCGVFVNKRTNLTLLYKNSGHN